jgi:hypothetical protein
MRDCPHCSASFEADDEVAYLEHLRDEHPDEFGSVDRRRLDQLGGDGDDGVSSTALLLGGLTVVVVGIVVFVTFGLGGSSPDEGVAAARTPSNVGGAHYHGTMEMVVLDDRVDFSQQEYQLQANAFHFEGGDGRVWHGHAEGVTLEWAMASLGIEVTESSVTFEVAGRVNLGEGALDLMTGDHRSVRVPDPRRIDPATRERLVGRFETVASRSLEPVFGECGARRREAVSLGSVKTDRRALDEVVMGEVLDLSDEVQEDVYRGLVGLVDDRLTKASRER